LKKLPLFKGIDPYYATKVADALQFIEVKAEEVVLKEVTFSASSLLFKGETKEEKLFYFVEQGEFTSSKDGKDTCSHKVYDYFGDFEMLKDEELKKKGEKNPNLPVEFTVTAKEDSVVLALNFFCFCNDLEPVKEVIVKDVGRYNLK